MGGSASYRLGKKIANAKANGASQEEIDKLERQRLFAKENEKRVREIYAKYRRLQKQQEQRRKEEEKYKKPSKRDIGIDDSYGYYPPERGYDQNDMRYYGMPSPD